MSYVHMTLKNSSRALRDMMPMMRTQVQSRILRKRYLPSYVLMDAAASVEIIIGSTSICMGICSLWKKPVQIQEQPVSVSVSVSVSVPVPVVNTLLDELNNLPKVIFISGDITHDTAKIMKKKFKQYANENIDVVIDSNGGSLYASYKMSDIILAHTRHTRAIVPDHAYSAGSLIAMSCNDICMNKHACLSPIDVQVQVGGFEKRPVCKYTRNIGPILLLWCRYVDNNTSVKITKFIKNKCQSEDIDNIINSFIYIYDHNHKFTEQDIRYMGITVNNIHERYTGVVNYFIS